MALRYAEMSTSLNVIQTIIFNKPSILSFSMSVVICGVRQMDSRAKVGMLLPEMELLVEAET